MKKRSFLGILKREMLTILEEQKHDTERHASANERREDWIKQQRAASEVQQRIDEAKRHSK